MARYSLLIDFQLDSEGKLESLEWVWFDGNRKRTIKSEVVVALLRRAFPELRDTSSTP